MKEIDEDNEHKAQDGIVIKDAAYFICHSVKKNWDFYYFFAITGLVCQAKYLI